MEHFCHKNILCAIFIEIMTILMTHVFLNALKWSKKKKKGLGEWGLAIGIYF